MAIDHEFLFAFAEAIQSFLIKKLNLASSDGASRCASYLAEDESIIATRRDLTDKKKRLETIQTELLTFGLA